MKRVAIIPQQVRIAAPPSVVLDVLSTASYELRSGTGRGMSPLNSAPGRVVVAYTRRAKGQQTHIIKELIAHPPDLIAGSHLSGPFEAATEEWSLKPDVSGTQVVLRGEVPIQQESASRLYKLAFEYEAMEQLLDLRHGAEARARPLYSNGTPSSMLVPVPVLTGERDLLQAVEEQEDAEWGHPGHGRGVARIAESLAEAVMLPDRQIEHLNRAALLHDAGKIALHSSLWGSRTTLSPDARAMMEAHPRLGYDLAARVGLPEPALLGILHHHEHWDGLGYPERLAGEAIIMKARILFLAEAIDSMMRATYRRPALSQSEVLAALQTGSGKLFDPMLTHRAVRIIRGKVRTGT